MYTQGGRGQPERDRKIHSAGFEDGRRGHTPRNSSSVEKLEKSGKRFSSSAPIRRVSSTAGPLI